MHIGYCRCSTNQQENSVERQQDEMLRWAKENNVVIEKWFIEEPISGSTSVADRPALTSAISELKKNDTIVVSDLTRISRSQMHFSMALGLLHQKGAHIAFADGHTFDEDDMMSRLMTNILAFCAEWERKSISVRVKQGLKVVSKTKALGRPDRLKFGWVNVDGLKQANAAEQKVGLFIQKQRKDKVKFRVIVEQLNERGWFNRNGNSFSIAAVAHINKTFEPA